MRGHIENLKQRPEHVRHRVAIGVSAGVTGLVAVFWLTAHIATGTFALSSPQAAPPAEMANARGEFSELVGAVGETLGATPASEPELTIVDGNTTSTITPGPENQNQTSDKVIPF
jgi:hypothetical protein